MRLEWLKAKQTRYTAYFVTYLLIVLGVLGAANWLANRHNKSLDTTANKRFSLSDQTEKVVRGLKQDVNIRYFDRSSSFDRAEDLLDRYGNLSTRLSVEYIDPDKKPQLARAADIRTLGTIKVDTGAKSEEAKSVTEEEITSALIRALKTGERTVCAVSGSGEGSFEDSERRGYSNLKEALEKSNYKTRTISLLQKPEVPKDCTILLVGGPRFDYTEPAVNAIKTYVEAGGNALFMLEPPLQTGREDVAENAPLLALLTGWGVTLDKNLILDASGIGMLFGLSELVPLVANYEFHAIVREMKGIATAFPYARSLETKSADKTTVDKLFSTTDNSFATSKLASAEITIDPAKDKKGPFVLGAAGTYRTGKEDDKEGRFVVVGSSGWVANNFIRFNGNRDLVLNMVNWLSSDEDLISIRPKEPEDRRLTMTVAQMRTVFWTSVVGIPLLVVAAGIGVWWRRR